VKDSISKFILNKTG